MTWKYNYLIYIYTPIILHLWPWTSSRREITEASVSSTRNAHICESEIATTSISTEDIIILCITCSSSKDIFEDKIRDNDTIWRNSRGTSVEIVLLDVDAIDRDAADFDVAVGDILNEASSVEVALDARAILGINN